MIRLVMAAVAVVSMRTAKLHVQMDLDDKHRMDLNEFYDRMKRTGADAVQVAPNMRLDMPTPERRKRMLDILAETLAFFRERNVPTTVWSSTLGYGGDLPKYLRGRFEGSARVSTAKGQVGSDVFCPTDEAMFRQVLRNARDFAAAGATAIQWDDDLFSSRAAPCCVCSNHLARIAKILGRKVTAEEAEKSFAGKPNDVRRAVLRASGEAMMDFARRLRAELDKTAPHVDMTFCLSNPLWDVEGLDVLAFAGALQAKDRKERFFRLSGASYWPFLDWGSRYPGMDLGSVMEFLRVQSSWVRDRPDVVAIDENDTYPRRTKEVPAWAFSLYDKVIAADGGVRRNPYMLRTEPYGFDPAYADVFEREMPATERLVAFFAKTVRYGVRVLYPQRQIAEADVATGRQGLEALYSMPIAADFLSRLGVPTKFDGADEEGPVAAFDSVAAHVSAAELRRGVITDRRGAQLLEARGVETGVKAMPADALCFTHANAAGERFAVFNCDLKDFDFTKPSDPAMRAAAARALAFLGSGKLLRVESDARVYHVFARNPRDGSVAVLLENLSDREAEIRLVADGSVLERVKLPAHGWEAKQLKSVRPLHLHNEDSTQFWYATPKEHLTEEGARRWVRDIIEPGLTTHFYMCTGGGGYARAAFDSKVNPSVAEVAGQLTREQDPWDYAGRVKLLRDRGVDVFAIWIDECRKRGVSPWITIRVNDVHGARDPESPMNAEFIRKHPELRLAKSCFGAGGLDFRKKEVRDYLLAFAEENLARYDVDGVEFDWLRHADCLPEGDRWANRGALTETMRGLRRLTDAAAKRRGHPVKTGARVFTRPRIVERAHGCDVFGWAREKLVDVVVPCNAGDGADFAFPFDEWRTRMDAANPDVLVVPGLDEFAFYDWERSRLSPADYAGFADWVRSRGAPGIYTFDLTPHERGDDYPALHPVFKAVHAGIMRDPGVVSRRYPYGLADDRDENGKWTVYLPRNLHEPRKVSVCVGTVTGVTRVRASVGYRKEYEESPATYELNGVKATAMWKADPKAAFAPDAKFKGAFTAEFPVSALRSGANDLVIRPVKPSQDYISAALVEVEVGGAAVGSDAASAPGTTVRESVVSLNGDGWRFRREDTGTEDFSRPGLDVSGWSAVRVPHDWAIAGPFDPKGDGTTGKLPWRGVGWYRRDFALSSADEATLARGGRAYLELDGVMANPRVWVNGILAGRGDYGYLGLVLDVTEHLRKGRNELAVAADTRRKTARWYPGAGIYRDVTLRVCPPRHVIPNTMYVTTPFVSATAAVVRLEYALPRDGVRGSGSVCPRYTNEEFTVRNPRLWCPEDPHLYAVERFGRTFRYGIRTAEFTRDDGFHLNGRRVQLKGVCLHHDLGPLGAAFNRSAARRQLEIMREMGANAIRTSHNVPASALMDLCDEMGFLVWDESLDKWDFGTDCPEGENDFAHVLKVATAAVVRDRSHPCVICWSFGNELQSKGVTTIPGEPSERYAHPTGTTRARVAACVAAIRAVDPTRPATLACSNTNAVRAAHLADLTLCGWNYANRHAEMKRRYPDIALVYSESASTVSGFGEFDCPIPGNRSDYSFRPVGVSGYDHLATRYTDIPEAEWNRLEVDRYLAGEFVWTGIDYLGEPTPRDARMGMLPAKELARSSYFGICDLCGFAKDRYWLYRSYWAPEKKTVHILPHWNWEGKEGQNVPVYVYTDADEGELFLNGRSLGRRAKRRDLAYPLDHMWTKDEGVKDFRKNPYYDILDRYRLRWLDVAYQPGELKVVTYKGGRRHGEATVRTAGKAAKLALAPESCALPDDGESLVFVRVDATDAQGVRCPRAANRVTFKVTGPAVLEAVGNGNALGHDSFKDETHPLYNGTAAAVLRRLKGARGKVTLTATSKGLASASCDFE